MSVNKVILVGNLGKIRRCGSRAAGVRCASSPLATSETWNDAEGHSKSAPSGTTSSSGESKARTAAVSLESRQVYVEGAIRSHSYDDKDGNKRYMTEIIAQTVRFLGGGAGRGAGAGGPSLPEEMPAGPSSSTDDDIPF